MIKVLYAFISVSALGILLGVALAIASKLLAVKKDKRIAQVEQQLPGLNCGACGYAGCAAYAEAIVEESVELTKCTPGGQATAKGLAAIMGQEVDLSGEKMVAQCFCNGDSAKAKTDYEYQGIRDCNAVHILYEGNKVCKYGCLGMGSCIRVCPVDAISYRENGLVWVDKDICISCERCIKVCPTGVMQWIPYDADYMVICNSKDKGAAVRKYCEVGCIACKLCEKKSPEGGYKVEDNLSRIDYSAEGEREEGMKACPTNCIIELK
jgi:RnfABCDGE-type electron transport complex B subunit